MSSSGEVSPGSTLTPSGTPGIPTQPPKYGTLIPNRIFVGGIAANTTDGELKTYFDQFGAVKDCKIISDRAGVSKGYGFVTFETQEDAEKIIRKEADNLIFRDRKLNIGPAIRKQAFPRMPYEGISSGTLMFTNGVPYTYQNGLAVFSPEYAMPAQTQHAYPTAAVMLPQATQPVYLNQATPAHYGYQSPPASTPTQWPGQWRWAAQNTATPVAASTFVYPSHAGAAGEMMYPTYQTPEMTEALMEATPPEGSMVMEGVPHYVEMFGSRPSDPACHNMSTPNTAVCPTAVEQSRSYLQMSLQHYDAQKHPYVQWGTPHMTRSTTDTRCIGTRPDVNVQRTQVPCKRSMASPPAAIPRKIISAPQCTLPYTPQASPVPIKMTATPQSTRLGITPLTLLHDEIGGSSSEVTSSLPTPPYTPVVDRSTS